MIYTYSGHSGDPGSGGSAATDGLSLSQSSMFGGPGGGSGANGGYARYYYSSSSSNYYYSWGPGAGGGGGGGGIMITAGDTLKLSGKISVPGGNGGYCYPSSSTYYRWPGAGGAGAGGNVVLQAKNGFSFGLATIDAGGGRAGEMLYGTSVFSRGGKGGDGAIVLRSNSAITLPEDLPTGMKYGNGTVAGGDFQPTKYGVSTWQDSGAAAPEFVSRTLVHNGGGKLWMQGAQTDLLTGEADETNATSWLDVSSGDLSGLNGYRWFRFKAELVPVIGDYPEVSSVQIDWKYRK